MASARGDDETFVDEEKGLCGLCLKDVGRYTCPRCHLRYCSSTCYKGKSHMECSEAFYKDCFMEGLRDMQASSDEKRKMTEMLKRLEEQDTGELDSDDEEPDEDDSDEEAELETRLKGLDLDKDTDQIWTKLTKWEQEEFQSMLGDGRIGHLVGLWEPWWKVKRESLVEDIAAPPQTTHPPINRDIPDAEAIFKRTEPSPKVPYILVNVLYGYAYVARLYNGDHLDSAEQSAQELQQITSGLGGHVFSSVSEAIHGAVQSLHEKESSLLVSRQFSVGVIEDVRCIMESDHPASRLKYTQAALSDLHKLMRLARKGLEKDLKEAKERNKASEVIRLKEQRQKCYAAIKKVEYLLSWVSKFGVQLTECTKDVELEFYALSSELSSHNRDEDLLEKHWGGKRPKGMAKFIEEITER